MKFVQSCPCGADVRVEWAPHAINTREDERRVERAEARKLIDQFRTAHRPCLKRLDAAPPLPRTDQTNGDTDG